MSILTYENHKKNIKYQQWTIILELEHYFLLSLSEQPKKQGELTNPLHHIPEDMELLTISVSDIPLLLL